MSKINDRKISEEELHESEEKFKSAFDHSVIGEAITFPGGRFIVNLAFCKMLGYSEEEGNKYQWQDVTHPDDVDLSTREIGKLLEGVQDSICFEKRYLHKDGSVVWAELRTSLRRDKAGKPLYYISSILDINERKRAEESLRVSEERFRAAFHTGADAFVILNEADGRLIEVNEQFLKLYKYEREEVLGKTSLELGLWAMPEQRNLMLAEVAKNGYVRNFDVLGKDKFGKKYNLLYSVRKLKMQDKSLLLGVIHDNTEQKQAEEIIRNQNQVLLGLHSMAVQTGSELRLPQLLANVLKKSQTLLKADRGGGIYLFDPVTKVLTLAHGTGINIGREGTVVRIGDGVAGRVFQTMQALIIDDYTRWEGRSEVIIKDPPSTVLGVPLFVESKVIGVLTFVANSAQRKFAPSDVQQAEMFAAQVAIAIQNAQLYEKAQEEIVVRTKAENELRILNDQLELRVKERTAEINRINIELERANRAKDEFLANMSHELRSPLNGILGLSEILLGKIKGPINESQEKYIRTIDASGRHLLSLINDILDISKIEAGKFEIHLERSVVSEVCQASLAFVKEMAMKKNIRLDFQPDPTVVTFVVDPKRIKQILVNLLTNAVKFTPAQGKVTLSVKRNPEMGQIQFSISDTGIGIAPDALKKLFKPFSQVDSSLSREQEGTGLGLVLVKELTELHGGGVKVESEIGKGSCFTITLPNDLQAENINLESLPYVPPIMPMMVNNQLKTNGIILLAEDNPINAMVINDYLKEKGYQIFVAPDGAEALKMVEELIPNIILMDIQMPVMDGLQAIRAIKKNPKISTIPIIAITALAMVGDKDRCLAAGADDYLTKPIVLANLEKAIHKLTKTIN